MTDPIVAAARLLASQLEYARHQAWADEFLADIEACARLIASTVRGPAEQKYLGPCGADLADFDFETDSGTCEGDVYAYRGARVGRCRTCGAEVATSEREAWLDGEVRSRAFLASQIAEAYGLSVKTIRSWATDRPAVRNATGKLVRSATSAWLRPHAHGLDGQPLYLVADVLDLAAADAARRESNRSRRSRAATSERVS